MKDYRPNTGGSVVRNSNMIENYITISNDSLTVMNLDGDKYPKHSLENGVAVYRYKSLFSMIRSAIRIARIKKIEIIHAHNFRFLLVGYICQLFNRNTKLVVELHAIYKVGKIKEIISYYILSKANLIIVLSESAKRYLIREKNIKQPEIIVIRNGAPSRNIEPKESDFTAEIKKIRNKYCVVAYMGSFFSWQGVRFIADNIDNILEKIPNIFILMLGDGPEYEYVYNALSSSKYAERTVVHHSITKNEIDTLFKVIDVVLIPREKNMSTNTAVPLKVVEAMQNDRCILASDDDGISELLNESNAKLFRQFDIESFIAQLHVLSENKVIREQLGNKAKEDAKNCLKTWEWNAYEVRKSYQHINIY